MPDRSLTSLPTSSVAKWATNNDEWHLVTLSNLRLTIEWWLEVHRKQVANIDLLNNLTEQVKAH